MAKEAKVPTLEDQLERATARIELLEKQSTDPFEVDGNIAKLNLKFEDKEKNDVREAIRNPAIRRFLFRLLNMAQILSDSSDPNPYIIMHHSGKRSLGLQIYRALTEIDPGIYFQMERESISDKKSMQKENTDDAN